MKRAIAFSFLGALGLAAASVASARAHVAVVINPFGYEAYPPVVYHSDPYYDPYYAAPPVVYFGRGSWGGGREWRSDRHAHGHYRDEGRRDREHRGEHRDDDRR